MNLSLLITRRLDTLEMRPEGQGKGINYSNINLATGFSTELKNRTVMAVRVQRAPS